MYSVVVGSNGSLLAFHYGMDTDQTSARPRCVAAHVNRGDLKVLLHYFFCR
jgi:hypothetical protein